MSRFNSYARDLDKKARELFNQVVNAKIKLEEAKDKMSQYSANLPYDYEYNINKQKAKLELEEAKQGAEVANNALSEFERYYKGERIKLLHSLNEYFALDPELLHPETMEILNSGIATANDYKRLYELAESNNNITMLRMIGARADEFSKTEGLKTEDRALLKFLSSKANAYSSDVKIADYDSQYEILHSEYYGLRRQELEDVTLKLAECFGEDINQALHFKLELKPTPPTPEEFSKILDEIERQVLGGDIE